jgi:hypothetical protein
MSGAEKMEMDIYIGVGWLRLCWRICGSRAGLGRSERVGQLEAATVIGRP